MTKKTGRPPYKPDEKTRAQILLLSGMGVPDYDIIKVVKLSAPTMRKYYSEEMALGNVQANAKVAQSLYKQAISEDKPNVAAAIFWLKTRAGWRETQHIDHTSTDGSMTPQPTRIELVAPKRDDSKD